MHFQVFKVKNCAKFLLFYRPVRRTRRYSESQFCVCVCLSVCHQQLRHEGGLKSIFVRKHTGCRFWSWLRFRFQKFQKLKNEPKKTPFCTKKHVKSMKEVPNFKKSENKYYYFGVLIKILFSKCSKTQKWTQKDPLFYQKSWKRPQSFFDRKLTLPILGCWFQFHFRNFQQLKN